jgi:NAD(P)-dependent dehydrogenase (short-subunit alcohol dehydrogenase family)
MTLAGQRIGLIGGGSGIGLGTAKLAAAAGAEVVIVGRSGERLEAALTEIGAGTEGHRLDAMDEPAVAAFFARPGAFDHMCLLLLTTTGPEQAPRLGPFAAAALDDLRESFEVKFRAVTNCVKYGPPICGPAARSPS